jgi:hypothetical protein
MKKQKKYYVITTGVAGVPHERGVAGPWFCKKDARQFVRCTFVFLGTREIAPSSTDEYESWRITGDGNGVDRAIPGVSRKFRHQVLEFMDQNDDLLRRLAQ